MDAAGKGAVFFDPADRYIWSLVVDRVGQRLRRHRRQGRHLQDHARRQGRAVLRDQGHACDDARLRPRRPPAGRHRSRRAASSASTPRANRSCSSTRATPRSARSASMRTATSTSAAVSGRRGGGGGGAPSSAPEPSTPVLTPSVSTEITVVAIADIAGLRQRSLRRPRLRDPGRLRVRYSGSVPDGASDPDLGVARRPALRRRVRARRHAARRHGQQRQDLPPLGRSAAAHARRPRQRISRSRLSNPNAMVA